MGRIFWEYSSRGQLVPDEFTVKLWKQYIKGMEMIQQFRPASEILVLDGIPRNVEQARLLEDTLDVVQIVHLQCTDLAKMVERLRRRALKENRFDDANDEVIQKAVDGLRRGNQTGVGFLSGGEDRTRGCNDVANPRVEQDRQTFGAFAGSERRGREFGDRRGDRARGEAALEGEISCRGVTGERFVIQSWASSTRRNCERDSARSSKSSSDNSRVISMIRCGSSPNRRSSNLRPRS